MKLGYKVFDREMKCMGFQYESGKEYVLKEGELKICENGFHFCEEIVNCFNYYHFSPNNIVCEVEALGNVMTEGHKSVTDWIRIGRSLSWEEVLSKCNRGKYNTGISNDGEYNIGNWNDGNYNTGSDNPGSHNTGNGNAGDYNTGKFNDGDYNTGNHNTGSHNTGSFNTGSYNSGHWNTGNWNSGHWNTGHGNTGVFNAGKWNTGSYNTGSFNTGIFNTDSPKMRAFNRECGMTYDEWIDSDSYLILDPIYDAEGKIDWIKWWKENKSDGLVNKIKNLPNFDYDIWFEITGINLEV